MHKLTKLTPLIRKERWIKYKNKMRITKWKNKEAFYLELAEYYRVYYNTIRKIIKRARKGDLTVYLTTMYAELGWKI